MRAFLLILTLLLLPACAVVEVAEKPASFALCSAMDVTTTAVGVSMGVAVEKNPLLAGSVNAHHFIPLVLSKLAVVGLVWWLVDSWPSAGTGVAAATAITCGIAIHNFSLLL